jgi:hypothetical protein
MALAMFGLCLAISLSAVGSFAWITSQAVPWKPHDPNHRPLNEIRRDLANAANRCVYEGLAYHCDWQGRFSRELAEAHREDETPPTEPAEEHTIPGSGVVLTDSEIRVGHYFSATWSHLVIVAFASFGFAVTLASGYALTRPIVLTGSTSTPTPSTGAGKSPTEQAFNSFCAEYLLRDSSVDTPSELIRIAYRMLCLSKNFPEYNAEAFSKKLASWTREHLKTFEREGGAKKPAAYIGLALKDDAITQEARRSFENST